MSLFVISVVLVVSCASTCGHYMCVRAPSVPTWNSCLAWLDPAAKQHVTFSGFSLLLICQTCPNSHGVRTDASRDVSGPTAAAEKKILDWITERRNKCYKTEMLETHRECYERPAR
jgi:hypothetical protein